MKKLLFLVLITALLYGCGGGGGGGDSAPSHVPTISNLRYTPTSAAYGAPVDVVGYIDFHDPAGDVNMLDLLIQDASTMAVVDVLHMSVSGVKGMTSGTITIYVKVSTAKRGTFIFNINVRDEANQHSNPLTGTFLVY